MIQVRRIIHEEAARGDEEAVKRYLKAGVDPNLPFKPKDGWKGPKLERELEDYAGAPPLHFAALFNKKRGSEATDQPRSGC